MYIHKSLYMYMYTYIYIYIYIYIYAKTHTPRYINSMGNSDDSDT